MNKTKAERDAFFAEVAAVAAKYDLSLHSFGSHETPGLTDGDERAYKVAFISNVHTVFTQKQIAKGNRAFFTDIAGGNNCKHIGYWAPRVSGEGEWCTQCGEMR